MAKGQAPRHPGRSRGKERKERMNNFSFAGLIIVIAAVACYMLPAITCEIRDIRDGQWITWIDLLFGWTVLGWIAALLWAIVEKPQEIKPVTKTALWSEPFYK